MKLQFHCEQKIEPKCPHFGVCGGCTAQHIPYEEQLFQKELFVRSLFSRPVDPIVPCDFPWQYRNKMEFSFSQDRKGEKFLGLMRKRGWVENLNSCDLTHPWFIEVVRGVREWFKKGDLSAYHPPTDRGTLRTLTLRKGIYTGEKMVVLTISGNPAYEMREEHLKTLCQAIGEVETVVLRRQMIAKKMPTRFEEHILSGEGVIHEKMHDATGHPYLFQIRPLSFFQPNTLQAEILYGLAIGGAELEKTETLFDLYCGTGTLGIFASKYVRRVKGIEIVPEAVADARTNIELNGISNMEVVANDVGREEKIETPSTVIVDPPRVGLTPQALEYLKCLGAKKIVYVSCNPITQANNCKELELFGYQIERLIPVDQFPHTPHVENIVFLRRNS